MNDSVPPPHAAPANGQAPQSWQNPAGVPYVTAPQAPVFDPRRAMGSPATHSARQGTHPVMAPPPMRQDNLAHAAPSPYEAPAAYDAPAPYPGQAPHTGQAPQSAPPYAPQPAGQDPYRAMAAPNHGYTPGHYDDQNYGEQPHYNYPPDTQVEPAKGRVSLLSRLTGRMRPSSDLNHPQSPEQSPEQDQGPAMASARKPFLMGLLTGVVVMLILGQVFRAAGPSADYAQALPTTNMTVTDGPVSDDPEIVAFLDTVEGLN